MFGSSLGDLASRKVWNHRAHRSRTSSTSIRSMPSSPLTHAKLRPRFPSDPSPLYACRSRPGRLLERVFRVCERSPRKSSARQPCEPSEDVFQSSPRPFEGCCCGVLRVGASSPPRLLSLLPCCVHLSLHTGRCAPTLCSARALRARCQFGRSEIRQVFGISVPVYSFDLHPSRH